MSVNARQFGRYATVVIALAFTAASLAAETKVVLLGTGTPGPDPERSGPATAIVVNDTAYLVDFGPGVVRRARAAEIERGIKALAPTSLRVAFVTPKLLILYHYSSLSPEELHANMLARYPGHFVIGRDLDVY